MSERHTAPAREGYSQWFVIVVAVFVTCLITANITAVKLVNLFGFILPAGVIVFPISYIAGDVLTEVYGFRHARPYQLPRVKRSPQVSTSPQPIPPTGPQIYSPW